MPSEIAKIEACQTLYGILSELLSDPREPAADAFVDCCRGPALDGLGAVMASPRLAEALAALAEAGRQCAPEDVREQTDQVLSGILSPEFPPYSTRYGEGVAFREQEDLADIAGFYRAFGVGVSPEKPDRPDHARMELEFLALLCHRAIGAIEAEDEEKVEVTADAMRRFLRDYAGSFLFALAEGLRKREAPPIYAAWARVLHELLVIQYERLGLTLPEPVRARLPMPGVDCGPMACLGDEIQ